MLFYYKLRSWGVTHFFLHKLTLAFILNLQNQPDQNQSSQIREPHTGVSGNTDNENKKKKCKNI